MGRNQSSAKYTWCGRGTRRGRAACACACSAAGYFSFLPSLKRNLGLVETLTWPCVVFSLCLPNSCPRAAQGASPGPLPGFQYAFSP